jgi:tetratricopeptide (TPR) repeat protein
MMRPRQRQAATSLAILAALAAACGARAAAPRPVASPPPPASRGLDLAALARSIDPGEVPPLASKAPPVLAEVFASAGGESLSAKQLAAQMSQLATSLTQNMNLNEQDLARVLALVYMAGLLEGRLAQCDLDCLGMAEQAYAALDIPWLAEPDAFLGQLLALGTLMQRPLPEDQGKALLEYMRSTFAHAALRHRSIAARVLRDAPRSEAATATLRNLAARGEREGDYRLVLRLREAVIERGATGFSDLAAHAMACLLAERIPCAERALARARAASDREQSRIDGIERGMAATRSIVQLARARGLTQRLDRAHLLLDVGRHQEAIAEFDKLTAAHPRDARPLVGRARAWFDETRSAKAIELVHRARGLEHMDQRFYELAVGLTFQRLMGLASKGPAEQEQLTRAVAQHVPELRSDVEGLARFNPGTGGVLRVVVGRLQECLALMQTSDLAQRRARLGAITRAGLADALALRGRFPAEPDVYRLIFLAARFASQARDYSAAATPIPAGLARRDELLLMQAGLLYSFAVSWGDRSRVEEIVRDLDALSAESAGSAPARMLRADTLALQARLLGRPALWSDVAAAYRGLLESAGQEDRARIQNNLGVALWQTGDRDGASAAWAEAISGGEAHGAAQLNSTVTSDRPDLRALDQITDKSDRIGIQTQALRWKIALAHLKGAPRRAALQRAQQILSTSPLDDAADGSSGVVLEESFNVGVGYSSRDRLLVQLYLGRSAFLLLPAPGSEPATKVKKGKKAKKKRTARR